MFESDPKPTKLLTYRIRREHPIRGSIVEPRFVLRQSGDVDTAVDDRVRHVDALGPKLPCQALREGPDGELPSSEVCEVDASSQARRGARDDQRGRVR